MVGAVGDGTTVELNYGVLPVFASGLHDSVTTNNWIVTNGNMTINVTSAATSQAAVEVGVIQTTGYVTESFNPTGMYQGLQFYNSATTTKSLFFGTNALWNISVGVDEVNSFQCANLIGTYVGHGTNAGHANIVTSSYWHGSCAAAASLTSVTGVNLTGVIHSTNGVTTINAQTGTGTTFVTSASPSIATPTFTSGGSNTIVVGATNLLTITATMQSDPAYIFLLDASSSLISTGAVLKIRVPTSGYCKALQVIAGGTYPMFSVDGTGGHFGLNFGSGSGSTNTDTNLYRSAVNSLTTDGNFTVGTTLTAASLTVGACAVTVPAPATISGTNTGDQNNTGVVGISIDGGSAPITTGIKGYIVVPYAGTLNNYSLIADQSGSISIDVWKIAAGTSLPAVGQTICGSNYPALSSAAAATGVALTSWSTVAVTANDMFGFNVRSASTVTKVTLSLKITKS